MNRFLLLLMMAVVLASSVFGSSTTCDNSGAGNYAAVYLVGNYSCTSGNLVFSNFMYSSSGTPQGNAIPANGITVTPLTTTGFEGLQFAGGWHVGTQSGGVNSFQDSLLSFTVTGPLTDLHLFFNGSLTGTGLTNVTEHYCLNTTAGVNPPGGCTSGGQIQVTNPPFSTDAAFILPANVTSISVSKDINATSGANGTASISQVQNNYSNRFSGASDVPEPLSFVLLGSGLLGLGLVRKRIYKKS